MTSTAHDAPGRAAGGATDVRVERVRTSAYEIPTATDEESDGTLVWRSTGVVVVEVEGGGATGLGYTYCDAAAAAIVDGTLARLVEGADAMAPGEAWARMQVQARQLGQEGLAAMAISAVDVALWDLKARLLGVALCDALPRFRDAVPAYGSGGFTSYSERELREQLGGWAAQGFRSVKMKVGRDPHADPARVTAARAAVGDDVELMVDANGAYTPARALAWAQRYAGEWGVTYFEEPVSSQDVRGMRWVRERAPAGMAIAAGEYGWGLPSLAQLVDAEAVDILQADVSRCGGITNLLRVDGLCKARSRPFSAHCVPAVMAHAGCALETLVHVEYFFDHVRAEGLLFDGAVQARDGLLRPDRSRPGLGLELKRADAQRYAA
ncbi:MAG TPA: enolase C-terminal domain-like protein [Conexibacter sp.]|nr:enolase C-terminal domain-like protein [Conexibacter sp.]